MRRLITVSTLFTLVALGCGREASVVPVVSGLETATPEVTVEPTPTLEALASPSVTPSESPTPSPTETPVATTTPTPTPVATHVPAAHTPTPKTSPPESYLRGAAGELKGDITYYNWQTGGNRRAYEDDTPDPSDEIDVTQGETLTIQFTRTDKPSDAGARYRTSGDANAKTTPIPIGKTNPTTIRANFPRGTVWVDVFTYWPEGNVEHTFKVFVK